MSYVLSGVDVTVTDPSGAKVVVHPSVGTPDCGSALGLQQMLSDLGYYQNGITGYFNVNTFAALQRFADDIGLPYTPGYYPSDAQCGAMIAAWQNLQAKKEPYPRSGVPTVMPGFTPEDVVAALQAKASAGGCAPCICPPCAAVAPPPPPPPGPSAPSSDAAPPAATQGFWGLDAFGLASPPSRRPPAKVVPNLMGFLPRTHPSPPPTIGPGSTGPAVKFWQRIVRVIGSGRFDNSTVVATQMWQRSRGIKATGIVGPDSWRAAGNVVQLPDGSFSLSGLQGFGAFGTQPTIGVGRSNPPAVVKTWQTFLNTILTKPIVVDGQFGSGTKAATIAFQKGAKISADGVVGPGTWAAADNYLASQQAPPAGGAASPGTDTRSAPNETAPSGGPMTVTPSPMDNAKAWWTSQSKTTQLAVMGGGALALVGLIMVATKHSEAA